MAWWEDDTRSILRSRMSKSLSIESESSIKQLTCSFSTAILFKDNKGELAVFSGFIEFFLTFD